MALDIKVQVNAPSVLIDGIPFGKGTGATSVAIGTNTTASSSDAVAIGSNTEASGTSATALGDSATSESDFSLAIGPVAHVDTGCDFSVAIGNAAQVYSDHAVAIGKNAYADAVGGISLGHGATVDSGSTDSIAIGTGVYIDVANAIAIGKDAYGNYADSCIIGSNSHPITALYIGSGGLNSGTIPLASLNPSNGSGSNHAGGNIAINGGKGTGSGTPGSILFQTSTAAGSSSTLQTLSTRVTISSTQVTSTLPVIVPDDAYNATSWNGNNEVPTKNAVRDQIESISVGSGISAEQAIAFSVALG